MQSGDKVLADHLASCGRCSLYTSKPTQNELIGIGGSIIQSTLVGCIQAARIFSVMADEAADASNKEQLAICLRFVDQSTLRIERFMVYGLCFSECNTGTTGEAIADRILSQLDSWQLSASQLCGQTYNGAGAMAGKERSSCSHH